MYLANHFDRLDLALRKSGAADYRKAPGLEPVQSACTDWTGAPQLSRGWLGSNLGVKVIPALRTHQGERRAGIELDVGTDPRGSRLVRPVVMLDPRSLPVLV